MGSLDAWLLLRSLRTLHLRIPRQSENATILAKWLSGAAGVRIVFHSLSLEQRVNDSACVGSSV